MRVLVKPRNLYFLIPFSFVIVCVISSVNYVFMKNVKSAVYNLLFGFITAIFYQVTTAFIGEVFDFDIFNTWWPLVYFYIISILFTIVVVSKQQKFIQDNCSI